MDLRRQRASVIAQMQAMLDAAETQARGLTADEETQYQDLDAQQKQLDADITKMDERKAQVHALNAKLDEPQRRAVTPGMPAVIKGGPDTELRTLATWIRTADPGAARELRTSNNTGMNIGTPADGGVAVPTGHFGQIIARRDEQMLANLIGVRRIAGVGTTVNVPVDDEADGEFITKAEMGDDNTTNVFDRDAPALNTVAMTLVKYTKKIELTDELLQDEDSNLLAFIEQFVGRGMAKTHNDLLVTEALANGTAAVSLASSSTIAATEVPKLYYSLPDYYATDEPSVAWIMRRSTEGVVRALAGTTNFYYAPTPAGQVGMRPMLWGAPLYNTGKVAAIAASAKSMILGNFYFMGLREAPSITMLRDPFTVDGKVILKYYFRAVYKVLQAGAIVYATHPTA